MPQQGSLEIATKLAAINIEPQEIAVISRGYRFLVTLLHGRTRGHICENFGALPRLPNPGLGPVQ